MTTHTDAYMERLRALQLELAGASGALEASVSILLQAYNESEDSPTLTNWRFLQESHDNVEAVRKAINVILKANPSTYGAA